MQTLRKREQREGLSRQEKGRRHKSSIAKPCLSSLFIVLIYFPRMIGCSLFCHMFYPSNQNIASKRCWAFSQLNCSPLILCIFFLLLWHSKLFLQNRYILLYVCHVNYVYLYERAFAIRSFTWRAWASRHDTHYPYTCCKWLWKLFINKFEEMEGIRSSCTSLFFRFLLVRHSSRINGWGLVRSIREMFHYHFPLFASALSSSSCVVRVSLLSSENPLCARAFMCATLNMIGWDFRCFFLPFFLLSFKGFFPLHLVIIKNMLSIFISIGKGSEHQPSVPVIKSRFQQNTFAHMMYAFHEERCE